MNNKRGLSTVVTTLIIVLLVLVAISIVWVVVRNILEGGAEQIEIKNKCRGTQVKIISATCTSTTACTDVVFEKIGTSNEEIAGVRLVFRADDVDDVVVKVTEISGLENLVTKTVETLSHSLGAIPEEVDVVVFFIGDDNTEQLCSERETYNLA